MTVALLAGGVAGGATLSFGIGAQLAKLEADLAAAADLSAQLQVNANVDPTAIIRAALSYAADASAALALSGPSLGINASLNAQVALVASLQAQVAALRAKLTLLAGLFAYLYTGPPTNMIELRDRVQADMPDAPSVSAVALVAPSPATVQVLLGVLA